MGRLDAAGLERQKVDFGVLADRIGFLLRMASVADLGHLARACEDKSFTSLRMSLLVLIGANPGRSQIRLGEALKLTRPATTVAVDFWEVRGCVERRPDPRDGRSLGLYLTPKGVEVIAWFEDRSKEAEARLLERLNGDEAVELRRLLAKMLGGDRHQY